jgi:spermidine synthase
MLKKTHQNKLIYLLFFLSGISGLIYETVWLRVLIRVLGSTVYATSIVLSAFMAGLAVGSYFFGRFVDRYRNPLRLYALLELGVGITAIVLFFLFGQLIPLYHAIYTSVGGARITLTFIQALILFGCLLVPTSLMGGTLPVLSTHTKLHKTAFTIRVGNLYGLNTLGAVLGVVGSGLFTLGSIGEMNTVFIGVFINLLVSLIAFSLSSAIKIPQAAPASSEAKAAVVSQKAKTEYISPYSSFTRRMVLVAYALNGFAALAYEVVWTRMFQLHLGTSIYAFSMMLGVYLIGVALGSIWGGGYINKLKDPLGFFGFTQVFIAFYSILGLYLFTIFKPVSTTIALFNIIMLPVVMVLPITFVLGLIFPAVSRSYVEKEEEVGSGVGRLYSMNTFGCILGSLVCGFILIRVLGTKGTILALAGVNLVIGLAIALTSQARVKSSKYLKPVYAGLILSILLGIFSPDPFYAVLKKEIYELLGEDMEIYYHKESVAATTTAFGSRIKPLSKYLWINGIGMTFLCTETKLMAHLPLILNENPQDILVVCFGMGTTLRSARVHKDLQCDVVELVPETYECYKYFHKDGHQVLADPRVHHFVDDGRNFLLMRDKKYDVITMDPAPPLWSAGTVNLYAQEFFELCRSRLKPGGIMSLWVPPHAVTEVRMIMRTFQTVFPNATVWRGIQYPGFYLIGSVEPLKINPERFRQAYQDKDILADLTEWDNLVPTPEAMMGLYLLSPEELTAFVRGEPIITDNHPYTEFPLWRQTFHPYGRYNLNALAVEYWKQQIRGVKR